MPSAIVVSSNSLAGTATLIVAHKTTLKWATALNTTGAAAYVQLFDAAAASDVTLGTTIPRLAWKSAASDPSNAEVPTNGVLFKLGIVGASTTTLLGSTAASQHVRLGVT